MSRLTFECPETGKPLSALTIDDAAQDVRIAVHCPKCSQLHMFSNADAVEEREMALS